ncbi:DUF1778 domain-containing protein [Alloalcanivorax xenomutans]|uniref:type II toxin-antitoxin system TacA family antitoxin n=1 Tax=Alloalcanivorax xenomutans TaxID=1094342 RepID=UPI001F45394A|nr:DUF1778 domain-containing protein [Alloalcanivorax xenomutans]MCE7524130.1 DUF1778 domain-containing protein [Alloalcanivorax xenomutans]
MEKPSASSDQEVERITLHMDTHTKALMQRAADARGLRLAEFVRTSAVAQARRLLSQITATRVSHDDFCRVLDAIENPPTPMDDLVDALR